MKALIQTGFITLLLLVLSCLPSAAGQKLKSLCQLHYPTDYLVEWECVKLTKKDTPYRVFGKQWRDGLRFNRMDRRHFLAGVSIKVPKRLEEIKEFTPLPDSYPEAGLDPKFILIDQNEMFLGAYEFGKLVFSTPVAVGAEGYRLQNGSYRIDATDPRHKSSLYPVEGTDRPYPMHYALRIFIDKRPDGWTSYWLHGRDLPGYPASHGCIGLYDEEMQKVYYGEPSTPLLKDAKKLYQWVVGQSRDNGAFRSVRNGPKVLIMGAPQVRLPEVVKSVAPGVAVLPPSGATPVAR